MMLLFGTVFLVACVARAILANHEYEESIRSKRAYNYGGNPPSRSSKPLSYNPLSTTSNNNDYQTPYCKAPPACLDPHQLPDQHNVEVSPRVYFVTATTCWGALQVASALLGRAPRTNREVREMCLTEYFGNIGKTYISGYGKQIVQTCPVNSISCYTTSNPVDSDPGTNPAGLSPEDDYLILSQEGVFAIYYRCINNQQADIQLVTVRPYADRYIINSAIDAIIQLGFSTDQIVFSQCQPPTVYPPFQNYPIPAINPAMGSCPDASPKLPPYQ